MYSVVAMREVSFSRPEPYQGGDPIEEVLDADVLLKNLNCGKIRFTHDRRAPKGSTPKWLNKAPKTASKAKPRRRKSA